MSSKNRVSLLGLLLQCVSFQGRALIATALLLSLTSRAANAQTTSTASNGSWELARLTIVNTKHRKITEEKVKVLLLTACRVVAEEFHRDASETVFRMTLVLGEKDEHFMLAPGGDLTLYLDQWDEAKFLDGAITGAVQRLTAPHIRSRMVSDILRRSNTIAPVDAKDLSSTPANRPHLPRPPSEDCFSAVRDAPCAWTKQPQR